jgi:hypothetical protein
LSTFYSGLKYGWPAATGCPPLLGTSFKSPKPANISTSKVIHIKPVCFHIYITNFGRQKTQLGKGYDPWKAPFFAQSIDSSRANHICRRMFSIVLPIQPIKLFSYYEN